MSHLDSRLDMPLHYSYICLTAERNRKTTSHIQSPFQGEVKQEANVHLNSMISCDMPNLNGCFSAVAVIHCSFSLKHSSAIVCASNWDLKVIR